jgi:hypothetical protein
MHKNRFMSMLAIAAFGGALVAGGCASAATGAPAAATTASARATAVTSGTANIMIYGVNTDGAYFHAIVSGVIGDYGPAVSIYPNGTVDPQHTSEMVLRLIRGSFRIRIAALIKAFGKVTSHEPIGPKTCSDLMSATAATPIVAGSGTGAYRGIRGSFSVTLTGNEVEARPCGPDRPSAFRSQLLTAAGSGTVSF